MPGACDRCNQTAELELWRRVFPVQERIHLCPTCSTTVQKEAEDRGEDGVDGFRLNNVARAVGGDVWRVGDRLFWFSFPVGVHTQIHSASGRPPLKAPKKPGNADGPDAR